jgi:exopolysaccharide biosynthesis polyprenyl glycosylphosphotransferase
MVDAVRHESNSPASIVPGFEGTEPVAAAGASARRRVLIVGAGARGRDIARELSADSRRQYHVVGFVDDDASLPRLNGLPVLGGFSDVLEVAEAHAADEIILAYTPNWQEELIKRVMERSNGSTLGIKVLPGFYDAMVSDCHIERVQDIPLVRLTGNGRSRLFTAAKRTFDILFSVIMLVLCAPVIALAAAAVKLTSRGAVFYCQERVGRGGRVFRIYKLRTMVRDAEGATGPVLAQEYDRRITTIGRIMRKTRIDEIPQFWNVLRGQMSIVGPRPERPEFAEEFALRIPGYTQRLNVRPGITGLAQVYGDYLTSVYHKLRYDWIYMHRMSLWQELRILLMTVVVVLTRAGT